MDKLIVSTHYDGDRKKNISSESKTGQILESIAHRAHRNNERNAESRLEKNYFDNNSTTWVPPEIIKEFMRYVNVGNPSNTHHKAGRIAANAIQKARERIAADFKCGADEILFTACATESNNAVIQGIISRFMQKRKPIHILYSAIEHKCVGETISQIGKDSNGMVTFEEIPVDADGRVHVSQITDLIKPQTRLICCMYANNELGTLQPVHAIGKMLRKLHARTKQKIHFHVDAVAAIGKYVIHPGSFCDSMSISGHKIHCVKGIGCLYVSTCMTPFIRPLTYGGKQQVIRSGTDNTAAIHCMSKALEMVHHNRDKKNAHLFTLRRKFITNLEEEGDQIEWDILGPEDDTQVLPNTILICFYDLPKWENTPMFMCNLKLIKWLDEHDISASIGSSCNTKSKSASHVLSAIDATKEQKRGTIRITMSDYTTAEEVDYLTDVIIRFFQRS